MFNFHYLLGIFFGQGNVLVWTSCLQIWYCQTVKFSFSNCQNFPISNCQKFPFQTVKFSFSNCQIFLFQTVKISLFQTVKISLFQTVKISFSKLSNFSFSNCQNFPISNCQNFGKSAPISSIPNSIKSTCNLWSQIYQIKNWNPKKSINWICSNFLPSQITRRQNLWWKMYVCYHDFISLFACSERNMFQEHVFFCH
jgi:hypothetical protein